ncbi:PIN-like domain-containing protein [Pantoea allii]|uniref:PIN-like domain-containing protein n=1 Tax=Pantoea allii TaxID=574096 RepID=UPI001F4EFA28|nr:PIN-like domain-containing protein [Pantoea allii]MCH9298852.1 PIN-like domain-containing protein [Pantoea allii]
MRSSFSGFYGVTEEAIANVFTSADTIFVFDANILLTLYRCEEDTRNRFFEIWEKIKDKCWFPHQVCLEYQRNRLKAVSDSREALGKIPSKINSSIAVLRKEIFGNDFSSTIARYSNLRGELEELIISLEKTANEFSKSHIETRRTNIDFINNHDVIRDKIDELTDGRIGPAPADQSTIDALNKSGKTRYLYKIGPGYDDEKAKENKFYAYNGLNYDAQYGDYYVWSQVLDYVDSNPQRAVVYVTNDAKSDFFYRIDGQTRGPNESLITEMKNKGASEFLLQNIDTFLHHANTHLHANIDESAIDELANASKNGRRKKGKWSIQQKLSYFHKNPNFVNDLLSGDLSDEELHDWHDALKHRIQKHSNEIKHLNSISKETLDDDELVEVNYRIDKFTKILKDYQHIYQHLTKEIIKSQESDAIQTLLNDIDNMSAAD